MRILFLIACLVFVMSLLAASPAEAKGGRWGGRARHGGGAVCNGPHCPYRSGGYALVQQKPASAWQAAATKTWQPLTIEQPLRDQRVAQAEPLRPAVEPEDKPASQKPMLEELWDVFFPDELTTDD